MPDGITTLNWRTQNMFCITNFVVFLLYKTCGICLGEASVAWQGSPIIAAECCHYFHSHCINRANVVNVCPTCYFKWNKNPVNANHRIRNHSTNSFLWLPEPLEFCDDELVPGTAVNANGISSDRLCIKAIPELPAVSASESESKFAVLVGLKAPSLADHLDHAPIDLVTVLDVSGSMKGSKLALVKSAVIFVIDNLGPSDRLSIVSFSSTAYRMLRLTRMTEHGREAAKQAVNALCANGGTNIVDGLKKGVQVLEERHQKNPVSSIIFLSDGNDTCNHGGSTVSYNAYPVKGPPGYLNKLPPSICPGNKTMFTQSEQQLFPVHTFGFGSDHDPIAMHAISDSSGGTFSFVQSFEMVQDAFAGCIGGLLSAVIQGLRLTIRAASHEVLIKSIPSGRYMSKISNDGTEGEIDVGDMYAEETREFLVYVSIPTMLNVEGDKKTTLLDITCSYKDIMTKEILKVETDLVEIGRPTSLSPADKIVNQEVDRQRNRLLVAESIAEAQRKAESGDLNGARDVLSKGRSAVLGSASGQAGDSLCKWLETEMKETEKRMSSISLYQQTGRAFMLEGMSSHANQRATARGQAFRASMMTGAASGSDDPLLGCVSSSFGASAPVSGAAPVFTAYATRAMAKMVNKSQQHHRAQDSSKN